MLATDIDGDARPTGGAEDIGSDETTGTFLLFSGGLNKISAGGAATGSGGAATTDGVSSTELGGLGGFAPAVPAEDEEAATDDTATTGDLDPVVIEISNPVPVSSVLGND